MPETRTATLDGPATGVAARSVYLDNAATSFPKPQPVVNAVRACLDHSLTVQRSAHIAHFRGDEVLWRCRVKLARFIHARQPEEIVYTYSATDGLNLALNGLVRPGGHVIVSPLEHHSVMRPLHHYRRERGSEFTTLPAGSDGVVDPGEIKKQLRPETCLVVLNWISNVTGTVQPVAQIGALCRELGIPYLIDASQVTGSHPVDVQSLQCDVLAQPAHKALLSLPGLGVLFIRDGCDFAPWRSGGTGQRSELLEQPVERPWRYESGTPNVPAIVGLDAALDWFEQYPVEQLAQRLAGLTAQLAQGLAELPGVTLIGVEPSTLPDPARGFVLSFTVDDADGNPIDPLVLGQLLAERCGISSRAGLHCAPTAHRHFGTYDRGGTVRFSLGWATGEEDVEYTVEAVRLVSTL